LEILLAKDLAFRGILAPLILPRSPFPGIACGLVSLANRHHSSVAMRLPQRRWRFAGGRLLPVGALQALVSVFAGFAEMRRGSLVLAAAAAGYLLSVWFYGRLMADMRSD
jgi:hypothetical protein